MSSETNLHDLAKHVINHGLSLGADQVEAYAIFGSVRSVQIERGAIRRFTDTSNSGIGVRVIKDKSIGMTSTTIFTSESFEKIVKDAFSLASISPPDPNFESLPFDDRALPEIPDKFDPSILDFSVEDFTELILESIQEASVRDDAVISGNFSAGNGERFILNSLGVDRESSSTSVSGYLGVKIQDGDDVGNAFYFDSSPLIKNFDYRKIGSEAAVRAQNQLGSQKISTTNLPILLDPDSTYATITQILANGINAFSVFNKTAFFVDKIGDQIASDKLSITDNPLYPGGTDSSSFDDEGIVSKEISLVDKGILNTYITDSYTAPLVGLENTGHASRGSFSSRPTPSPYSLSINAGESSKDELLSDIKEGILLIGSPISSMGGNPQISAQINQGFYVKDGEIQYPVKNAVIGGTVFEIYDKIEQISKERQDRSGHIAPWIQLEPMKISGGK
ncbi:MAG: TldD/PmbA family protein [Candidatus Heimdallarchaeota archaeon]|nr:TldD/PmbA family protein [Candidatus Heimdallarchaeota archaeon]MCK4954141.1 TldD/PmbA family protein [Candidatus Heimdallarchaeota archaeon]